MIKLTLEEKLRSSHVKRWQIVRVAREQNIAEHMYRVYLIAMDFCYKMSLDSKAVKIGYWALMHDLPEVITGDIATPTKQAMRLAIPDQDPIRRIELSLDHEYGEVYSRLKAEDPICLDIVKLADLFEAIDFLVVEGIGEHARRVLTGLQLSYIEKVNQCEKSYPDVDWRYPMKLLCDRVHTDPATADRFKD